MSDNAYYRRVMDAAAESRQQAVAVKRQIARLYEQAAEDMAALAGRKKQDGITAKWAYQYAGALRERTGQLWADVEGVTVAGMQMAAERQVALQTSLLSDAAGMAGIDLKPTLARVFGSVPDRAVAAVMSGSLYAPGANGVKPTLSGRIWNNAALQSGEIERVIAAAIAEKQSPMQLARALEAYVKPDAAIPSTWNSVYKSLPFQYDIDYNAKRLAVTALRHSAWMAEISAAVDHNPYADVFHWELSAYHMIYDICDDHADHEEGLGTGNFPVSSAPLPHPFCTCLWYVDSRKSLDQIAKELYRWQQGESNPLLDRAFGEAKKEFTSRPNHDKIKWQGANFPSQALLDNHYEKHLADYQEITPEEYVNRARALLTAEETEDVKRLVRSDQSVSKYRVSTNEFAVGNADGTIRTYFIPKKGANYWNDELERNK